MVVDLGEDVVNSFHEAQGLVDSPPSRWLTVTRLGDLIDPRSPYRRAVKVLLLASQRH